MSKHRRDWKPAEKIAAVRHYQEHGMAQAVREYGCSKVSIYAWEKQLEEFGEVGLSPSKPAKSPSTDVELKKLQRENERLMRIIAEKEVQLSIQRDLLKKNT